MIAQEDRNPSARQIRSDLRQARLVPCTIRFHSITSSHWCTTRNYEWTCLQGPDAWNNAWQQECSLQHHIRVGLDVGFQKRGHSPTHHTSSLARAHHLQGSPTTITCSTAGLATVPDKFLETSLLYTRSPLPRLSTSISLSASFQPPSHSHSSHIHTHITSPWINH